MPPTWRTPRHAENEWVRRAWLPALVLAASTVIWVLNEPDLAERSPNGWGFALLVAMAAPLAWRHRAPVPALAATAIAAAGFVAASFAPLALVAPLLLALFFVGLAGNRTHTILTAVTVVAVVAAVELMIVNEAFDPLDLLADAALALVPLVAGDAFRSRHDYVAGLVERAENAERVQRERAERLLEQQRLEIARELHDVVAHTIAVVNVRAGVAAHLLPDDPYQAQEALEAIRAASAEALNEIRGLIGVLRTEPAGTSPDLTAAPAPGLADIPALLETFREEGIPISDDLRTAGARVPDGTALAAYRLIQEACRNAVRHGSGAPLHVHVQLLDGELDVDVMQQAPAAGEHLPQPGAGVGLIGVRERIEAIGGSVRAGPTTAGGFAVTARLPIRSP